MTFYEKKIKGNIEVPTSPRGVPHGLVEWKDQGEVEDEARGFGDGLLGRNDENGEEKQDTKRGYEKEE